MSSEPSSPNNTPKIIIAVASIVVLGVIGYLVKQNMDLKQESEQYEYKIEDLNVEILDLEDGLKELSSEIEDKDLDIEEKDRLLAEKELEILEKQKKIDLLYKTNRINKAEAEELRSKVEQLDYYVRKYQEEIAALKAQVEGLTAENTDLKSDVRSLQQKNQEVEQDNLLKQTILEAAAILKAFNFEFGRVKASGKLDEDVVFRSGRLKELEICFMIMENTVAEAGPRDLYITIFDPKGKDIKGKQSGFFNFEDRETPFTLKKSIDYDRSTEKVCVRFDKMEDYDWIEGTHVVSVYCEGYAIGSGKFIVK